MRAVKPPTTPAVETVVTEIEATEVAREPTVDPEESEESRSEPPESEERRQPSLANGSLRSYQGMVAGQISPSRCGA